MAISSIGIGSGLEVESIISQTVALEKKPIEKLEVKAEVLGSKISTYAQIKSLTDDLNSAVRNLTLDGAWSPVKITSSNASAVSATMTAAPQAASYNIEVLELAQSQTSVSGSFDSSATAVGTDGTLKFSLGKESALASADPDVQSTLSTFSVAVSASDTLASVVAKINGDDALSKHVMASVITASDGKQQLMLRSRDTGSDKAFSVTATPDSSQTATTQFNSLNIGVPAQGGPGQKASDAKIKLNGVELVSTSNTFADTVPGLSITVSTKGASSLLTLAVDKEAIQTGVQKFVDAYNALNTLLSDSTKYDKESNVAGALQGDSSTVSLQNSLRLLTQGIASNAKGAFTRLSDVGIQMLQGGELSLSGSKLSTALSDIESIKSMFKVDSDSLGQGGGIATNFKKFTDSLLAWEGTLNNKTDSLEKQKSLNQAEQQRITTRASALEAKMRTQYSALDVKMSSLNALNSYVSQMVTTWNKAKS